MWFWVIRAFWNEGSGVEDGLLSVPIDTDKEDIIAHGGLLVFNAQEEAQAFIDDRHPRSDYEPTPLRHTHIVQTVVSEYEGTPDRIFYLGGYKSGDKIGGAPLTAEQFRTAIENESDESQDGH